MLGTVCGRRGSVNRQIGKDARSAPLTNFKGLPLSALWSLKCFEEIAQGILVALRLLLGDAGMTLILVLESLLVIFICSA